MILFETVAEHDEAIAEVNLTLRRALNIGQDHSNDSGGSSRATTEVDFKALREYKSELIKSKAELCRGGGGYKMGLGS